MSADKEMTMFATALVVSGRENWMQAEHVDGHRMALDDGVYYPEAKAVGTALTVGFENGTPNARFAVTGKTADGDNICIPLDIDASLSVLKASAYWLHVHHAHPGMNTLTAKQKAAYRAELRPLLEWYYDLGDELEKYHQPVKKAMDLRRLQDLATLEQTATEKAAAEMASVIRKLSMAASMPDGIEKSVLLDELQPVIRKAFS